MQVAAAAASLRASPRCARGWPPVVFQRGLRGCAGFPSVDCTTPTRAGGKRRGGSRRVGREETLSAAGKSRIGDSCQAGHPPCPMPGCGVSSSGARGTQTRDHGVCSVAPLSRCADRPGGGETQRDVPRRGGSPRRRAYAGNTQVEQRDAHAARADSAVTAGGGGKVAMGAPARQCSSDHETNTQWTVVARTPSGLFVARRCVPTEPLLDAPSTTWDSGSGGRDEALRLTDGDARDGVGCQTVETTTETVRTRHGCRLAGEGAQLQKEEG